MVQIKVKLHVLELAFDDKEMEQHRHVACIFLETLLSISIDIVSNSDILVYVVLLINCYYNYHILQLENTYNGKVFRTKYQLLDVLF